MVNPNNGDEEEKPLDSAMARVQAKLQRLMLIAGLTLGVGILAVFLAIIYRIVAADDKAPVVADDRPPEPAVVESLPPVATEPPAHAEAGSVAPGTSAAVLAVEASIPADARLIASTVAGGRIALTYDHFGGTIVIVIDPDSLQVVGRLDLKPE
jgi:hypothetical protein